jgi:hypothetical protein
MNDLIVDVTTGQISTVPLSEEAIAEITAIQEAGASALLDRQKAFERIKRDELLAACDWIELPSAATRLTAEQLTAWIDYRAALRAVPQQTDFPKTITWPTKP